MSTMNFIPGVKILENKKKEKDSLTKDHTPLIKIELLPLSQYRKKTLKK